MGAFPEQPSHHFFSKSSIGQMKSHGTNSEKSRTIVEFQIQDFKSGETEGTRVPTNLAIYLHGENDSPQERGIIKNLPSDK
jgi:hypothetical protein